MEGQALELDNNTQLRICHPSVNISIWMFVHKDSL